MTRAPFTMYEVENVISEESAAAGDYESSEATDPAPATFRQALTALTDGCWDNVDVSGDATIIAYPADYEQDFRTGDYSASELIITARRPEWADRLLTAYENRNRRP